MDPVRAQHVVFLTSDVDDLDVLEVRIVEVSPGAKRLSLHAFLAGLHKEFIRILRLLSRHEGNHAHVPGIDLQGILQNYIVGQGIDVVAPRPERFRKNEGAS